MGADPLILAIETSGPAGSTALLRGAEGRAEVRVDPADRGGSALHPGVTGVLAAASGESPHLVAAGIGPGSYTGTRIAVVFAKTFAFARGIPLIGVSALEAVALRACPAGRAAVLMPAHDGHAYAAIYETRPGEAPRAIREPGLVARPSFLAGLSGSETVIEMPPEASWASDVGRAAHLKAAAGAAGASDALEPLYLQAPAPERKQP
jgi:tRNA threonylcarbamoyladenosine biosynthesis protein TsaB